MSWQAYVQDHMMRPGDMVAAGIYGLDGGCWAAEGCIRPAPAEITRLITLIQDKETDFNGIKVAGISFLHVSHDSSEGSIILNRINAPEKEKYTCAGYLANNCFVFGAVSENYKLGNCSKYACHLRDYLKQSGF